jgi:3'-phosphoadenosine 5'-phosphosulfate sulfotransferase (PAPS reductase)/FAD synthetase
MISNEPLTREQLARRIGDRLVVASVSGGKDSAALCLWLNEQGIQHRRVFADTGWEHPTVYDYLRGPLTKALGPIDEVQAEGGGLVELVRRKGMFPSKTARFCTVELKVKPIAAHLAQLGAEVVNAVGVRAEESPARRELAGWEWSDALDCETWRPLLRWTEEDVIAIHRRHGLPPNPLYLAGSRRVGCWPCSYSRKSEIRRVADLTPERIDEIERLEHEVTEAAVARYAARGETLESLGYAEPSFFSLRSPTGTRCVPIREVVRWSRTERGGRQFPLFEQPEDLGCALWGLCETAQREQDGPA